MRKPVTIERVKCGRLWKYVLSRMDTLDVRGCSVENVDGLSLLTGDARRVAKSVITLCECADYDLGFGPEPDELASREYLATFL
jgi:hypothetical protein